jgi:hypothetical protein
MATLIPKYTQVNTANRTIAQKFAEIKSPLDYGAVGDGVADDTTKVEAWLAAGGGYIPQGCFLGLSRTVVVGNDKVIQGAGSKLCGFTELATFDNTDNAPMLALNTNYANTSNNAYNVDNVFLRGFSVIGTTIAVDANGIPTANAGTTGVDVTWTKDNIILDDVGFERLYVGVNKRDSVRADVVHWGIDITNGYVYNCRNGYILYPSTGNIDSPDIQGTPYSVAITSTNATSSNMTLNLRRVEVNSTYTTPADGYLLWLNSVKAQVSGYFEGNSRHIKITGGGNSQVVILAAQFSAVNSGGVASSSNGVPILMDTTATASLTLVAIYGMYSSNMSAFIETSAACEAAGGKLIWLGQGGNNYAIFKTSAGTLQEYPPLSISYVNFDSLRGYINTPNVKAYALPMRWSGYSDSFFKQEYIRRINNTTVATHNVVTFSSKCHGVVKVSLQDPTVKASSTYYLHQVWEFFCQDDGTVVATQIVSTPNGGGVGPYFQWSGKILQQVIQNSTLTTCALELQVVSESEPSSILTWA